MLSAVDGAIVMQMTMASKMPRPRYTHHDYDSATCVPRVDRCITNVLDTGGVPAALICHSYIGLVTDG